MAEHDGGKSWEEEKLEDDRLMEQILANPEQSGQNEGLFDVNRPLDLGDKADDAQDFEDISDDDLPDEEEATGSKDDDGLGLTDDVDMGLDDDDDLFGDNQPSTPYDHFDEEDDTQANGVTDPSHINGALTLPPVDPAEAVANLRALNFPEHAPTTHQDDIPADYEGDDDFIRQNWPSYEKESAINLTELFPPRQAHFIPKAPVKPPKPVNPTKVSLDLAPDQEKVFRAAGPAKSDKNKWSLEAEAKGLVAIVEESSEEADSEDEFDFSPQDRDEELGGRSMIDIEIACADWESNINPQVPTPPPEENIEPMDAWEQEFLGPSLKGKEKAKDDFTITPIYPVPNFDNFEQLTAQVAKRVVLDLNDPLLLVDTLEPSQATKRRRLDKRGNFKGVGAGSFASTLSARFNMSNDEAYEALKENHQSKVRATLGNISVEHSLPAQKLQYPFYVVKMEPKKLREYHRPYLQMKGFNQVLTFSKPGMRKRKAVKNLPTTEIFKESKDLSLADHYSSATLLEYSEEHPTVLSNFGMGNRIINYYRRKDADDAERPNPEDKVGDATVLLPEDKSPFANFGMVDPGETVRAIHNQMYRAPIFKHEPKGTDFLVIRSQTGKEGANYHIRNIDNLFVVGQQFPNMEIPGPHSRKGHLKIQEITRHISGSTDMQNRQKLKEFMTYDKADKVWRVKSGEPLPDEATIRAMVKPEEVCLIDAMQVGSQHLEDAGYVAGEEDEANEREDQSLEQNLAPWRTTKAFIEASADKAMLQLHGEGDPSGRGSAFSFIKTSMKGGYLEAIAHGPMASAAARVAKDPKANNGHTYNVKAQQSIYNEAIRRIWDQQKSELSNVHEPEAINGEMNGGDNSGHGVANTPAPFDDDNASVFSVTSRQGKVMRITRQYEDEHGEVREEIEEVTDPKVWLRYEKLRREKQGAEIE
ncbi:uncharacterized protein LY89DRAFT_634867 [Mollisia scopiformis]|uniref:Transcription initiation factor TFIID subunit 1 histone acetyltransferase domain-containing protein n=1 Tax=Mollisia scopiformis TaxID=149040 RepID=A0A194XWW4_MOLSC|nr:uncharacterized protein LY89DRAFT_634867 [Mollisia scopiformis]KUJ24646.1 hypothetical protein LY89DRAFT_634867 [Mollisia scopiformis]